MVCEHENVDMIVECKHKEIGEYKVGMEMGVLRYRCVDCGEEWNEIVSGFVICDG